MVKGDMQPPFSLADKPASNVTNPARALLAGVLRAFLFWNTGPLHTFRVEDGLFAYHSGMSAAERFIERMTAIGVLVWTERRGYRVTIRYDAIDDYSYFLVDGGLNVDDIVRAFVFLVVDGCINLLPETGEEFDAVFYDNKDGTASFDTREMLNALVQLNYATQANGKFSWSEDMRRIIAQAWAD